MNLFSELKRRGVFQVGMAYVVSAWLLVQVADVVLPAFDVPDWTLRAIIVLLAVGLPIALTVSWLFEMTSKGLVRADEAPEGDPVVAQTSHLLNYVIIGVLAAAVILFALDKFVWKSRFMPVGDGTPATVAVLPFVNMSRDAENDAFAAGIHDDLLTQLSKIHSLRTHSRTSVQRFSGSQLPIPEIAAELGADVVVEGGVQRSANRVRINAQLIDGDQDVHLWAETYDRELTAENIFSIQSEISRAIAAALRTTLTPEEEQRLARIPTENLAAYDAYSRARVSLESNTRQDLNDAVAQFSRATDIDPDFAEAWAGHCEAELKLYSLLSDVAHFERAEAACQRALALDDTRVEVHIALGTLYRYFGEYSKAEVALQQANYAKAEQSLQTALSLDSLTVDAILEMGNVYARQNRLAKAETKFLEALELAPRDWNVQTALATFYWKYSVQPDRFARSAVHAKKATEIRPDLPASWNNLGNTHYMQAEYAKAAEAWQHSLELEPNRTAFTNTGLAHYYAGNFEAAAEMQRRAAGLAPRDHRVWGRLADAQRFIEGEEQRAIQTYARAAELAREILAVNDQDWRTLGHLSVYLVHTGDEIGAEEAASRANEISQRKSEALFYSALVQQAMGRVDAALDLLEEAVAQNAEYRHLISNEPDFRGLSVNARFRALTGSGST